MIILFFKIMCLAYLYKSEIFYSLICLFKLCFVKKTIFKQEKEIKEKKQTINNLSFSSNYNRPFAMLSSPPTLSNSPSYNELRVGSSGSRDNRIPMQNLRVRRISLNNGSAGYCFFNLSFK